MGLKYRKSFKIAPGVKVNLSRKSAGVSIGGKYGGMSFNTKRGATARVSAPGTGLSYSTKIGGSSKKTVQHKKADNTNTATPVPCSTPKNKWVSLFLCVFLGYLGIHKFYEGNNGMGIVYLFTLGLFGIGWIIDIFTIAFKPNPYYA